MNPVRLVPLALAALLLIGCDGQGDHFTLVSAGNTSIENGAIRVAHERVTLRAGGAPRATIHANGDFAVDGKPVNLTPAQRALLVQYYADASAVREHGLATGKAGAAVAGEALKGAVSSVAGGGGKSVEDRVQAQADKVKQSAMKICDDMAGIRSVQGQLADQLPAFKPYGNLITAASVDECRKDDND